MRLDEAAKSPFASSGGSSRSRTAVEKVLDGRFSKSSKLLELNGSSSAGQTQSIVRSVSVGRVRLYLREGFLGHRLFDTFDDIVDACCDAWNALLAKNGRIASFGRHT